MSAGKNMDNAYEKLVPADKMPPCPICGKPIKVPPQTDADRLLCFHAHGMAALAHHGCGADGEDARSGERNDG